MATAAMSDPRVIEVGGGAHLEAQRLGQATQGTVLLVGAATWSMDWWRDDWCEQLVARGFAVLRYDQRDTGGSTASPVGEPDYTGADLVADAVAVLDAYAVPHAHVVGLSMGAGLAQRLAVEHRDRVATLTLLSSTPADGIDRDLPDPQPELFEAADLPEPDWSDPAAVITHLVEAERAYAGPGHFDEAELRDLVSRVLSRTADVAPAQTNHYLVAAADEVAVDLRALAGLLVLVVHGSADPLFPLAHGEALAAAVPGAQLLVLDGVGHQFPPPSTWSAVIDALVELAGRGVSRG